MIFGAKTHDFTPKNDFSRFVELTLLIVPMEEYRRFVFDTRYNIGITPAMKDVGENYNNGVLQLTLGYKFRL